MSECECKRNHHGHMGLWFVVFMLYMFGACGSDVRDLKYKVDSLEQRCK